MGKNTFILDLEGQTKSVVVEIRDPEIVKGWWSLDEEGDIPYEYGDDKKVLQLGETAYFQVEVKGIAVDEEITLKLYEYDYYWVGFIKSDIIDPDDDEFPEEEIIKKATVKKKGDKKIATVELYLDESWDIVLKDDSNDPFNLDYKMELYWDVSYKTSSVSISKELPGDKNDCLRVAQDRNLYFKPMADKENGLPEIYDSEGNMILFGLGLLDNVAGELGVTSNVNHFVATKIRVTNERILNSELNTLKNKITYEEISLDKVVSKELHYEVVEASDFVIKSDVAFVTVEESTYESSKKFSQYFNARDVSNIGKKVLEKTLKVIDYIDMTKALLSLFPKDDGIAIPNPINIISVGTIGSAYAGPFALIALTADLVVTPMIKEQIQALKDDSERFLNLYKLKGLVKVHNFLTTDSAKIGGYSAIEFIHQKTHDKVMSGEIDTLEKLVNDEGGGFDDVSDNLYYTYIIREVKSERRLDPITVIDSIFIQ